MLRTSAFHWGFLSGLICLSDPVHHDLLVGLVTSSGSFWSIGIFCRTRRGHKASRGYPLQPCLLAKQWQLLRELEVVFMACRASSLLLGNSSLPLRVVAYGLGFGT